jgi:hypothetical protein
MQLSVSMFVPLPILSQKHRVMAIDIGVMMCSLGGGVMASSILPPNSR